MVDNTHVPDKLYGYTLQVRHMMHELISLELDTTVSIEALDDVAVELNNTVTAEQIKSVQSTNNPLTDHSIVFWKCLYNWLQSVNSGELRIKTSVFKIIIISDRNINVGKIPMSFSSAYNIDEARNAVANAKKILFGENDELKEDIPSSYGGYLESLFEQNNVNTFEQIVQKMQVEIHTSDYDKKLFTKFCSQTIPSEYYDVLFNYMLGWIHEKVNEKTKSGSAAYISSRMFRDELLSQIRMYDQKNILAWVITRPNNTRTQHEIKKRDIYIKQLDFIELENSEKIAAANDFLRTSAQKTFWGERGIITPQSFDDYQDALFRMWHNQYNIISISNKSTSIDRGKNLYYTCQDKATAIKAQGCELPMGFGSGSLHSLANEPPDNPKIGWHPKYKELVNSSEGNSDE
jgi:hypothetical protein